MSIFGYEGYLSKIMECRGGINPQDTALLHKYELLKKSMKSITSVLGKFVQQDRSMTNDQLEALSGIANKGLTLNDNFIRIREAKKNVEADTPCDTINAFYSELAELVRCSDEYCELLHSNRDFFREFGEVDVDALCVTGKVNSYEL